MTNDYHFITHWRARGSKDDVYAVISDPLAYVNWWSGVYLDVKELDPGDGRGIGRRFSLLTKGRLPYRLRWESTTAEIAAPDRLAIRATGDFEGRGIWTLVQDGEFVDIAFDWKLTANKPLIRALSFALKPLFSWNHRWAMEQGRQRLQAEVDRRVGVYAARG